MRRPLWCAAFIVALDAELGNVSAAAAKVGKSRSLIYERRLVDPHFAREMDAAITEVEARLVRVIGSEPPLPRLARS
jgi:hypothetical protein